MRQFTQRILRLAICLIVGFSLSPLLQAKPRVMSDDEMDEVCAKGSAGFEISAVVVNQMVFDFNQQTSAGMVSGTGVITVELIPDPAGKSQIQIGPPTTLPGGAQTSLQMVNGTVRIREDLNITMTTLPGMLRALQQNGLVLPSGLSAFSVPTAGMGKFHR